MRAIEFRAWDMLNKNMLYNVSPIFKEKKLIMLTEHGVQHWGDLSNYKIMQYTGLKDKNDVKIFECDIVKYWKAIYEIIFMNGAYHFFDKKRDYKFFIEKIYTNKCKIIGNIYENLNYWKKNEN